MRIDLHIHSTASDGSLPPDRVAEAARAGGLDVIALTDHDTVAGVGPCRRADVEGVRVIPGTEISTRLDQTDIHMLGYYIDVESPGLLSLSVSAAERRAVRMRAMVERLATLGARVSFDAVVAAAGPDASNLSRPHLARALVAAGHVSSVSQAFERFIGDDGPAFVANEMISADEAIGRIHEAGGVAVWAHPRPVEFTRTLDRLVAAGMDGMECFRPRCLPAESLELEAAARARGLLVTGGSDWHGIWHGPLGTFAVDADRVAAFLERGGLSFHT